MRKGRQTKLATSGDTDQVDSSCCLLRFWLLFLTYFFIYSLLLTKLTVKYMYHIVLQFKIYKYIKTHTRKQKQQNNTKKQLHFIMKNENVENAMT